MSFQSCGEKYEGPNAVTGKICYKQAKEKEDEMKREIEDLKSKVSFLQLYSPIDTHLRDSTADILLYGRPISGGSTDSPSIRVHKAVLRSRSPVLKAMLETKIGSIKIPASNDVVKAFAHFLYTAEISDNQTVFGLIFLGEKYQVKHLKAVCEKFIVSAVNHENALLIFGFAHRVNSQRLIEVSLNMILSNMSTLCADEEYKKLMEEDPLMVVEIFEAYLSRQVNAPSKE